MYHLMIDIEYDYERKRTKELFDSRKKKEFIAGNHREATRRAIFGRRGKGA